MSKEQGVRVAIARASRQARDSQDRASFRGAGVGDVTHSKFPNLVPCLYRMKRFQERSGSLARISGEA